MCALGRQNRQVFSILGSILLTPCLAFAAVVLTVDAATQPAGDLSKQEKSEDAPRVQRQVDLNEPSPWLEHAIKSYSMWRQGNILPAMSEGEIAIQLNPTSTVCLINLALMKQNARAYGEAIDLYRRAAELEPQNWVPPLGLARCYIMIGDLAKGRSALRAMSEQTGGNFDWYYMAAKTWLEISDLNMAEKSAARAIGVASSPEQQAAAENLLLLVLLRETKFAKAYFWQDKVFQHNQPREPELYVRAAMALLPINDPAKGKGFLNCAIKNLNSAKDGDALFKLGRVFEDKAGDEACNAASRASWLEIAQAAYTQAIALNPKSADYHLAMASVFSSEGLPTGIVEELKMAMACDRRDIFAPFLIGKIANLPATGRQSAIPINLSLVHFNIQGLTCSCKLANVHAALRQFNNVAFISTPPQKPFSGLMLVDQSLMPAREMLDKCSQSALSPTPDSKATAVNYHLEMISEEPVSTVEAALKIADQVRFGPLLAFQKTFSDYLNRFQEVAPIMPVSTSGTASGIQSASSWSASL